MADRSFDSSPECSLLVPANCLHEASTFSHVFSQPGTYRHYCRILGVLGGDTAAFPNGRRLTDDVVDIELQALEGAGQTGKLVSALATGDGVNFPANGIGPRFPYVALPNTGSVNQAGGQVATQGTGQSGGDRSVAARPNPGTGQPTPAASQSTPAQLPQGTPRPLPSNRGLLGGLVQALQSLLGQKG